VNYFADWLSRTCVILCPETSTTKYYADNSTRTCVDTCPNSTPATTTYRDSIIRICMPICSGLQYSDDSTGNCVSICPYSPDYYGQLSSKKCVPQCSVA
jgi:hypothetical protein